MLDSLQATVDELNRGRGGAPIETQSELLTRAAGGYETTLACRATAPGDGDAPQPQYALSRNDRQQYCCVRDDVVTLRCDVAGGFRPTAARATWVLTRPDTSAPAAGTETPGEDGDDAPAAAALPAESETANRADPAPVPPPDPVVRIAGTSLAFDVDCAAVRCGPPAAAGLELRLEATGTVTGAGGIDWRGAWSTETGEVGRTLQLQGFVDAVRSAPDRYELHTPALLHFPGR